MVLSLVLQLLEEVADSGRAIEMENLFSRLTLDIIGKAVFDYDFDSLTHDDPIIQVQLPLALLCHLGCDLQARWLGQLPSASCPSGCM